MRRGSLLLFVSILLVTLVSFAGAVTFTVSTESEWEQGTLDGVAIRNDTLELDTPLEIEGFETDVALEYWDIYRGDAFVPESGFTGNDAIAFHKSDSVPGVGNVTQLNYSIPKGFLFEPGAEFSAWTKHNGSENQKYRVTYRLTGDTGLIEAWVDEGLEQAKCVTDIEEQVITTETTVDSWYQFVFRIYPQDSTVYCEIRDHNDTRIAGTNLSASIDFNQVVIRGNGASEPWAWFDDVTIPKYRTDGTYSQKLDNDDIQDWLRVQVDAANITAESDVDAVFEAQDSSGTTVNQQIIDLENGQQTYNLTVPPSQDGSLTFNGTTSDPSLSWSITSYTLYSNTTNISAPSVDKPTISATTATEGETVTFTTELTDDDYEQNMVALWTQKNGSSNWVKRNTTQITPLTVDTQVSFQYTFSSEAVGDHTFKFNTTDASGFTDQTSLTSFTVIENTDASQSSSTDTESEETTSDTGGTLPTGNATGKDSADNQNPSDETPANDSSDDETEDTNMSDTADTTNPSETDNTLFDERTVKLLVSAIVFAAILVLGYFTFM